MKNPIDAYIKKFFADLFKKRERARIEAAITHVHLWLGRVICDDRYDDAEMKEMCLEEIAYYQGKLLELDAAT